MMSLCISICANNEMIVAADTRRSIKLDDTYYIIDDNCDKLRLAHGKLIFMSGNYEICDFIFNEYKNHSNGSMTELQQIAKSTVRKYLQENNIKNQEGLFLCNFLIFEFCEHKKKPITTNIHSEVSFKGDPPFTINTYEDYEHWANGVKVKEADSIINQNKYLLPINELLLNTFQHVNCEEVGGSMVVYRISDNGIDYLETVQLTDHRKMNKLPTLAQWGNINPPTASQTGALSSNSPMLTHLTSTGVYTGTLTAQQVNAVEINAGSIKTGTLSADRIATNISRVNHTLHLGTGTDSVSSIIWAGRSSITQTTNEGLEISTIGNAGLYVDGKKVATVDEITALQTQIYNLQSQLDNKSDKGHTHQVTTAHHNHGNPNNVPNTGGGTYTTTGDS